MIPAGVNEIGRVVDINSLLNNLVDYRMSQEWDTQDISAGAGAAQYRLFANPIGSGATPRTRMQTSMREVRKFPAPECMVLDYIGFLFTEDTLLSDMILFKKNYRFEFIINTKVMWEGHVQNYPSNQTIQGHSTKTNEAAWGLGRGGAHDTLRFGNFQRYIAPNQLFECNLICDGTPPTFTGAVQLIAYLYGIKGVAVQ